MRRSRSRRTSRSSRLTDRSEASHPSGAAPSSLVRDARPAGRRSSAQTLRPGGGAEALRASAPPPGRRTRHPATSRRPHIPRVPVRVVRPLRSAGRREGGRPRWGGALRARPARRRLCPAVPGVDGGHPCLVADQRTREVHGLVTAARCARGLLEQLGGEEGGVSTCCRRLLAAGRGARGRRPHASRHPRTCGAPSRSGARRPREGSERREGTAARRTRAAPSPSGWSSSPTTSATEGPGSRWDGAGCRVLRSDRGVVAPGPRPLDRFAVSELRSAIPPRPRPRNHPQTRPEGPWSRPGTLCPVL
ncbi:hypothetical protein SAMN04489720_0952 [Agrococcus jejuensis]|uniref:Uncharacterized protein n=1 Tax=Agrococcus jejuensis TaxID=399736 RepID=A0A1G8BI31_9MICO|nr:hypothetical protein SAMN04489720_0952 [Agrococcus jejuensis]